MDRLEDPQTQTILMAVALGGAILAGAIRLFTSFSASPAETKSASKPQKSKPKAKNKANISKPNVSAANKKSEGKKAESKVSSSKIEDKKKADKVTKPIEVSESEEEESDSEVEGKARAKKVGKGVKEVQKPAENATKVDAKSAMKGKEMIAEKAVGEVDDGSKKKRKKKKKKGKVEGSDEKAVSGSSDAVKVEKAVESSAVDVKIVEEDLEGWETIPVRPRKPKALKSSDLSNLNGNANLNGKGEGDSEVIKKKEVKQVLDIGEYVSLILGEGGMTVNNIQNISGARVSVNRDARSCVVIGDEDQVSIATQMINSIISNQAKAEVVLTSRLDKAIIGKPDTKQRIRDNSGAKIEYKFGATKDDPLIVLISGEIDKVNQAKELINGFLIGKNPDGSGGVKRLQVNNFQGKIIIGQKGEMVNNLQKITGASINIEFSDAEEDKGESYAVVSVIGSEEEISRGVEEIKNFLAMHNYTGSVQIPLEARAVLGKLSNLTKSIPNLKVDVSENRLTVSLTGSENGVKTGKSMLEELIDDELGPPKISGDEILSTIELGSAAGKVIGKNRAMLSFLLKNSPGAKVEIKHGNTCYVYGNVSAVKKLAGEIEDIVMKHNEVVEKSKQEEKELQQGVWKVLEFGTSKDEKDKIQQQFEVKSGGSGLVAPESDWGGFKLAQLQGW